MSSRNQAKAFRQVGLPLLLLVGGGFFGLTYFLEGLFEVKVQAIGHAANLTRDTSPQRIAKVAILQGAQNKALALGKDPKLPQKSLEEELQVHLKAGRICARY